MYIYYEDVKNLIIGILLSIIVVYCTIFNYALATYICNIMKIPYNLALTSMSSGFAINLTLILTIIEVVVVCVIINNVIHFKKKIVNFIF